MSRTIRDSGTVSDVAELTAEISRLAAVVARVARQIGHDGVATALSIATSGGLGANDRVHDLAQQFLNRARQMENEVARFKAVAGGHPR